MDTHAVLEASDDAGARNAAETDAAGNAEGLSSSREPDARAARRPPPSAWRDAQADARATSSAIDLFRLFHGLVLAAELAMVAVAAALALLLRDGAVMPPTAIVTAIGLALVIMLNLRRLGDTRRGLLPASFARQLGGAARAWGITVLTLLVAAYVTHSSAEYSRLWGGLWVALTFLGLLVTHLVATVLLRRWRRRGRLARIVAVVDLDGTGRALARRLRLTAAEDVQLIGVFRPDASGGAAGSGIEQLLALSRQFRIDEVLVTPSGADERAVRDAVRRLSTIPTTVRLCPALPPLGPTAVRTAELLLDAPTLVVCRSPLAGWHIVAKRLEDLLIGGAALLLLGLPMLLIALLVRLDSPGPSLFRQRRLGFNNNPITVYKFRTMTHQPAQSEANVPQACRRDPRVTRLGGFLRRSSVDELPQLLNVLRGEMSLVGPRPHAIAHNVHYAALIDDYLGRHRVQPGITGWAQVHGLRGETDTLDKMQRRVEFDLAYIDRWSILLDLRIIAWTALAVLFQRTAY